MFRLAGIATGALLVGGALFFHLKSTQEMHHMPLPTLSSLSEQWDDCGDDKTTEGCEAFQTQQTEPTIVEKTVLQSEEIPSEVKTTLAPTPEPVQQVEAIEEPELEIQPKQEEAAQVEISKSEQLDPVDLRNDFEVEKVEDVYDADHMFSKIDETTQETVDARWQIFWSPFQSEIAAKGFAAQIAKISGVAVQVIKKDVLTYVVAFPYTSLEERTAHALSIEKAFGMSIRQQGDWS